MEHESSLSARRANIDDLPKLRLLWRHNSLPCEELEKRFTSFQLVENAQGALLAALEVRVEGVNGVLDSLALTDGAPDGHARLLFSRVSQLAQNRGLCRLWAPADGPFASAAWTTLLSSQGFTAPDGNLQARAPVGGKAGHQVLKLREETATGLTLEQEFDLFAKAQRGDTEKVLGAAKALKAVAWAAVFLTAILVSMLVYYVVKTGAWRR